MNGRKQECAVPGCGHDRASHHWDLRSDSKGNKVSGDCLCVGCRCRQYVAADSEEAATLRSGVFKQIVFNGKL